MSAPSTFTRSLTIWRLAFVSKDNPLPLSSTSNRALPRRSGVRATDRSPSLRPSNAWKSVCVTSSIAVSIKARRRHADRAIRSHAVLNVIGPNAGWNKATRQELISHISSAQHCISVADLKCSQGGSQLICASKPGSVAEPMLRAVPPVMLQQHGKLAHVLGSVYRLGGPEGIQRRWAAARERARRIKQNAENGASLGQHRSG
jgi:hypothetical protein